MSDWQVLWCTFWFLEVLFISSLSTCLYVREQNDLLRALGDIASEFLWLLMHDVKFSPKGLRLNSSVWNYSSGNKFQLINSGISMQWGNKWDLEVCLLPLSMCSLSRTSWDFLHHLLCCAKIPDNWKKNISIIVMPVLVRTFKIYLTSSCPRNKVGSIIESDQLPKMGRKVSPFLINWIECKHVLKKCPCKWPEANHLIRQMSRGG